MGADIVDVNMGCPVPKIAKHSAGCSLMREPEHAATVIAAMSKAVRIPVTVKMRAGWDDRNINAPDLAKRVEDAGAAAVAVHGRTAAQSYTGVSDWDLITQVAAGVQIPVFGSGDCIEAGQILHRMADGHVRGVLVGRGVLRNPWILAQASDLAAGFAPRVVTLADRGQFLLDYVTLLLNERVSEREGFRHTAPSPAALSSRLLAPESMSAHDREALSAERPEPSAERRDPRAGRRERWVINKVRALVSWYSKGLDNGGHLRIAINSAQSVTEVRDIVDQCFFEPAAVS
jgi:tRNA-dihydrouridine synthase B